MIDNFIYGKPIYDSRWFVGRRKPLEHIADRLLGPDFGCLELIGERRIGKTTILTQLTQPAIANAYGIGFDNGFISVFIDMGAYPTPQRYYYALLTETRSALQKYAPDHLLASFIDTLLEKHGEQVNNHTVQQMVNQAAQHQLKIYLMCDEFEKAANNPNFDYSFYAEMRALLMSPNLAMITSSRYPLQSTFKSEEILSSPFFNIFLPFWMGGFTAAEESEFIQMYQQLCDYRFNEQELKLLNLLGGRFPYYMQFIGSLILRYHLDKPVSYNGKPVPLMTWVSDEFLQLATPRFHEMWYGHPVAQQVFLFEASQGKVDFVQEEKERNSLTKILVRRGLLIERDGKLDIFSRAFAEWIRHHGKPEKPVVTTPENILRDDNTTRSVIPLPDKNEAYVFISYSRRNSNFALDLAYRLELVGIRVWIDQHNINPGEEWDRAIERAIKDASAIVVILSPDSVESKGVKAEVIYTMDSNKLLIPVMYEFCELPMLLRQVQYIDFRNDQKTAFNKLLGALNLKPS